MIDLSQYNKIYIDNPTNDKYIGYVKDDLIIKEFVEHKDYIQQKFYKCKCLQCDYEQTFEIHCFFRKHHFHKSHMITLPKFQNKLMTIFHRMLTRCYNNYYPSYEFYGTKGIKVCEEWIKDVNKFLEWAKTHGYNDNVILDRIDRTKDYCPENCKFVDVDKHNVIIEINGIKYTCSEWANKLAFSVNVINNYCNKYGLEKTKNYIIEILQSYKKPIVLELITVGTESYSGQEWAKKLHVNKNYINTYKQRHGLEATVEKIKLLLANKDKVQVKTINITIGNVTDNCNGWSERMGKNKSFVTNYKNKNGLEATKKMLEDFVNNGTVPKTRNRNCTSLTVNGITDNHVGWSLRVGKSKTYIGKFYRNNGEEKTIQLIKELLAERKLL